MQILPTIKGRWIKVMYLVYFTNSLVLLGSHASVIIKVKDNKVDASQACGLKEILIVQILVLVNLLIYFFMTEVLRRRVNKIEVLSRINKIINF
jgi:hypothetical protein